MILLKNYKTLNAASLVETLIALTICAICFAIAIMVFVQVVHRSESSKQVEATQRLNLLMYNDWLSSQSIVDDNIAYDGYSISRTKSKAPHQSEWSIITYKVAINNTSTERIQLYPKTDANE